MERRERQTGTGESSLSPAYPGNLAGQPVQTGLLPEASRSPLVLRRPLSRGRGPHFERAGLRCSQRGLHPARRCCCGWRREVGGAARAERGAPSVRLCGAEEAGPAGTRAGHSAVAGLWAGAGLGAASSSSSAASSAASSQCSVSREPRLVDAEPLGSAAASSSRCNRTSAWRPEPCELAADTPRTSPRSFRLPLCLTPTRSSCNLPFLSPLGKWFLLLGEVSGDHGPPVAEAMGQVTCVGGRVEFGARVVAAGSGQLGCPADRIRLGRSW